MKAQVLKQPTSVESHPLVFEGVPTLAPRAGEILIKVTACGACHTDLHIIEGELAHPKLPLILGHQVVGIVEVVGEGVKEFKKGDRVGVAWRYYTCGTCSYCQAGNDNLCEFAKFTGYQVDGGYAQYMIGRVDATYYLPAKISDTQAAPLLCAGVIGYRALRLSQAKSGETLGLYGFGASAHLVLQVALHQGCRVYVFTRSEAHRRLARELGATWVGGAEGTLPELMDRSIIFAPAGQLVPEALRVLNKGGRLVLAGIHMSPIPEMNYELLYYEKEIKSVANSTKQDVIDFLKTVSEMPLKIKTQTFPLKEANQVLTLLKSGQIQGSAVLIP